MRIPSLCLLLFAATACGGGDAGPTETEATETEVTGDTDTGPEIIADTYAVGDWLFTWETPESTRCGGAYVDKTATGSGRVAEGSAGTFWGYFDIGSAACTLSGSDFDCNAIDGEINVSAAGYGDVTVTTSTVVSGSFDEPTAMSGKRTVDIDCDGDDCDALAADASYGGAFPCKAVYDLTAAYDGAR